MTVTKLSRKPKAPNSRPLIARAACQGHQIPAVVCAPDSLGSNRGDGSTCQRVAVPPNPSQSPVRQTYSTRRQARAFYFFAYQSRSLTSMDFSVTNASVSS